MALTEREHAEIIEALGFDKNYVHPDHKVRPPVVSMGPATATHGEMTVSGNSGQTANNGSMKMGV